MDIISELKNGFYERRKEILFLFILALLVRIFFLGLILNSPNTAAVNIELSPWGTDGEYIQFAKNLIYHGTASVSDHVPPEPNSLRTPLYPAFLVPFLSFNMPYWVIALAQDMIVSLFVVCFYLGARILFNEKTAFWASTIFALEPYGIFISQRLISESTFIPFFIGSFFCLAFFLKTRSTSLLYVTAILLSVGALIRPITFYYFPFIPLVLFLMNYPWKKILLHSTLTIGLFFLILSPWMIRNYIKLGSWHVTSLQNYNTFFVQGLELCMYLGPRCDQEFQDAKARLYPYDMIHADVSEEYRASGMRFILNHPIEASFFFTSRIPDIFLQNPYLDVVQNFTSRNVYDHPDISNSIKNFQSIDALTLVSIAGKIFLIVSFILFLSSLLLMRGEYSNKLILAFTFGYVFLAATITNVAGQGRYRFIIFPLVLLLAIEMWYHLRQRLVRFLSS